MFSKDRNKRALCETASPDCERARKNVLQSYFVNICMDLFFCKNQISLKGYKTYRWLKSHLWVPLSLQEYTNNLNAVSLVSKGPKGWAHVYIKRGILMGAKRYLFPAATWVSIFLSTVCCSCTLS